MTMQKMVDILEKRGFKTTKKYDSTLQKYEFIIERNGIKFADFFTYSAVSSVQSEFLDRLVFNFEKIEQEKKSMKNIAFDISRDGPIGKLVIKDNVYDVCVKKVDSYCFPYDEKTVLEVETIGKNHLGPSEVARLAGSIASAAMVRGMNTTYNPTRKDSINEGKLQIKNVIFNPPATIIFWSDDSKTVVKAENDIYDPEKGIAMAIAKRALGNHGNYFDTFKKYVDSYKKKEADERAAKIAEVNATLDKPYYIWYEVFNAAYEPAGSGKHWRAYKRKGDAVRIAKKRYGDETKFRWMVSQENPWANGEWAKKFGKDS